MKIGKRGFIFYVLVLTVLGLSILLIVSKMTNKKVLAKSEEVIENSLKSIDETEQANNVINKYNSFKGETVKLSNDDKIKINEDLIQTVQIDRLIDTRIYVNDSYRLAFKDGKVENEDIFTAVGKSIKDIDDEYLDADKINSISQKVFGKEINFSSLGYEVVDNKVKFDDSTYCTGEYNLKIKKVLKNNETGEFFVYVDDVELNNNTVNAFNTEYYAADVKNTYVISAVLNAAEKYNITGIYCIDFE